MDPNRIIAASSWVRIANARIVTVRRYACSISAVEHLDCRRLVAKVPASPESSRLCQRLPPGKERKIFQVRTLYIYLTSASKISFFKRYSHIFLEI